MSTLHTVKLAHELQNLLTVLARRVQVLREYARIRTGGAVDADFEELDWALDGAFAISRELLAMGRPHAHERSLVNVNDVVAGSKGLLQDTVGAHIDLVLELRAADPIVYAKSVDLEWVLLNLVANARDAMPNGGVVTIATDGSPAAPLESLIPPRRHVRLTVSDTGQGIPAEVLATVFDPFTTTRSGSLGLGLTSVAFTVRALHGQVGIQTETGVGTNVHVYLPIFGGASG